MYVSGESPADTSDHALTRCNVIGSAGLLVKQQVRSIGVQLGF
jgi:hypothetical protein